MEKELIRDIYSCQGKITKVCSLQVRNNQIDSLVCVGYLQSFSVGPKMFFLHPIEKIKEERKFATDSFR